MFFVGAIRIDIVKKHCYDKEIIEQTQISLLFVLCLFKAKHKIYLWWKSLNTFIFYMGEKVKKTKSAMTDFKKLEADII